MQDYIKELNTFLKKKSDKQKLVVIYGPTASGKTAMSIDIAKALNSEIISTDSRQIFKYMDIGTAKITREEMDGIKHHMIDFVDPSRSYSVGEFKTESELIMGKLFSNGKIPILCGGTGLYIDSLIYDFNIPKIKEDKNLRDSLEKEAEEKGREYIFEKLKKVDPDYDRELHPNNLRYVIRAIEVKMLTGKSKTSFKKEKTLKYDVLFLSPDYGDRNNLYNRINMRVDIMIDSGLIGEIDDLIKKGYKKSDFGMKTIGYEEMLKYLSGEISYSDAAELIKKNTRNYAKRQLTWFRKYEK